MYWCTAALTAILAFGEQVGTCAIMWLVPSTSTGSSQARPNYQLSGPSFRVTFDPSPACWMFSGARLEISLGTRLAQDVDIEFQCGALGTHWNGIKEKIALYDMALGCVTACFKAND